jgi:hypothetical protein
MHVITLRVAAAVAVAVSQALNALGVFSEEAIHWLNLVFGMAIAIAAATVVFGWFARRAQRDSRRAWRTGVILALLGILTLPAFWSGLPPIFGVAAIFLGLIAATGESGRGSTARRGGIAAVVLGVAAVGLDVALTVGDVVSRAD